MTSVAEPTAAQSEHKRRVNDLIQESLYESTSQPVAFFCECESRQCFQPVWMTPEEYARLRPTRSLRMPGH
jgi:hypothetical protein